MRGNESETEGDRVDGGGGPSEGPDKFGFVYEENDSRCPTRVVRIRTPGPPNTLSGVPWWDV